MKQTSKKNVKSAVAILLMLAVVITGAFAYFTASDSRNNVFTLGDVDVILHEDGWVLNENGDYIRADGTHEAILPGIPIEKAPYVENSGSNPAWIFMTIGVPTTLASGNGNLQTNSANTNIPVTVYAIQDGYDEATGDAEAIWNAFFDGQATDKFGAESTASVVELFSLNELDTANWTQIGEAYNSADGYMYYVFAYNTMVEPDALTSKLFTSVTLDPALVGTDAISNTLVQDDMYYSDREIDANKLNSIFGSNPTYGGSIPESVTPNEGDKYASDTGYKAEYTDGEWVVSDTYDKDLAKEHPVPEEILGVPARNNVAYMSKVEGSTGVIDNFYIYGLKERLLPTVFFKNYFTLTGIESEVTYTATTTRYLGTGSVVTLKYPGNITQNYTIIIFGDVNGDSLVDITVDTYFIQQYLDGNLELSEAQLYAADLNRDGVVDLADKEKLQSIGISKLNQVDPSGPLI